MDGSRAYMQAFDPALHFGFTDRRRIAESEAYGAVLLSAEFELALNWTFGRSVILPFGHVYDSPIFFCIAERTLPAYLAAERELEVVLRSARIGWMPFLVTLNDRFASVEQFAEEYEVTPASYALLADRPQEQQYADVKIFCEYLARRSYREAARVVGDVGFTDVLELLGKYFGRGQIARPVRSAMADYHDAVRRATQSGAEGLLHHPDELWQLASSLATEPKSNRLGDLRGAWFERRSHFGEYWPSIQMILDAEQSHLTMERFGASAASLITRPYASATISGQLVTGAWDTSSRLRISASGIDWGLYWKSFSQPAFVASLRQYLLDEAVATNEAQRLAAANRHSANVAQMIDGLPIETTRLRSLLTHATTRKEMWEEGTTLFKAATFPKTQKFFLAAVKHLRPLLHRRIFDRIKVEQSRAFAIVRSIPPAEEVLRISRELELANLQASAALCDFVQVTATAGNFVGVGADRFTNRPGDRD